MKFWLLCLTTALAGFGFAGARIARADDLQGSDEWRIDCRYHDIDRSEGKDGVGFCYASAIYSPDNDFAEVYLAVGCDDRTLFNDRARIHQEMTLDRFQPMDAATPGIEVFPHRQLLSEGTYTSVLDIYLGRFKGLCYVHRPRFEPEPVPLPRK